ncbi:MAG: YIP1 family protein [Gemmatimonadota bacterium]
MDVTASTPPGTVEPGRSVWKNILDVFIEPSATFRDVAERPKWLVPLIISLAIGFALSYLLLPLTVELQRLGMAGREMTPEQIDRAMGIVKFYPVIGLVFGTLLSAVFSFFFWGWATVSSARNARYVVAFTAITYGGFIYLLQLIAQAVVVQFKGVEEVAREGEAPTFGLGLFLEQGDMNGILWGLIENVNFFAIWSTVVLAIAGIYALRMSRGSATAFAVALWVVGGLLMSLQ